MEIGDIVVRKSHHYDIAFVIQAIYNEKAILTGVDYRLIADAFLEDLENADTQKIYRQKKTFLAHFKPDLLKPPHEASKPPKILPHPDQVGKKYGFILHIDGDAFYLNQCLKQYRLKGIPSFGVNIVESKQTERLQSLLELYRPNILVITGHDSINSRQIGTSEIDQYQNSKHYVKCIELARKYSSSYDDLVIIAGGCQSYYEALMKAGANFASSPGRVLLNIMDPVNIACKIAMTSVHHYLTMEEIMKEYPMDLKCIGGIETRGQCRIVSPMF